MLVDAQGGKLSRHGQGVSQMVVEDWSLGLKPICRVFEYLISGEISRKDG